MAEILVQAGIESVTPTQLLASSVGLAATVFLFAAAISRAFTIAFAFATFAALGPVSLVRYRQRKRRSELRDLWPEAVDNLASAVRAGLSLPEALTQLGMRGPEELRRPFQRFGEDYRATGRFAVCLDRLKAALADPTGDRIVESLRLARDVGGTDLGRLLRTLSAFLREDARTRAELETRQGWSVNAVHHKAPCRRAWGAYRPFASVSALGARIPIHYRSNTSSLGCHVARGRGEEASPAKRFWMTVRLLDSKWS
jgi:tight adherence protein B